MKKRIIIISLSSFFIVLFIIVLAITLTKVTDFSVVTIKKSYCFVAKCNEEQELIIDVFVTNKNAFILEKESASNLHIKNKIDDESIAIELIDVVQTKEEININGGKYYKYQFYFNIPLLTESECEFIFDEAQIVVDYPKQSVIFDLGSFCFVKTHEFGDENISLTKIKPIVNYYNENKTLVALDINFLNNTNKTIEIINIKLLSANTIISNNEFIRTDGLFSSGDDLNDILGYKYDLSYYDDNVKISIEIEEGENQEYLFPLKYDNDYVVDCAGILIEYMIGNQTYQCYYDEILFFQSANFKVLNNNISIKGYANN